MKFNIFQNPRSTCADILPAPKKKTCVPRQNIFSFIIKLARLRQNWAIKYENLYMHDAVYVLYKNVAFFRSLAWNVPIVWHIYSWGLCFFFLLFRIMCVNLRWNACVLSIKKIEKIYIPCVHPHDHWAQAKQTRHNTHIFMSIRAHSDPWLT